MCLSGTFQSGAEESNGWKYSAMSLFSGTKFVVFMYIHCMSITQGTSKKHCAASVTLTDYTCPFPEPKHIDKITGKCLKYHALQLDHPGAVALCLTKGGHLATPKTQDQLNFLKFVMDKESISEVLIGLTRLSNTEPWVWIDDNTVLKCSPSCDWEIAHPREGMHMATYVDAPGKTFLRSIDSRTIFPFFCEVNATLGASSKNTVTGSHLIETSTPINHVITQTAFSEEIYPTVRLSTSPSILPDRPETSSSLTTSPEFTLKGSSSLYSEFTVTIHNEQHISGTVKSSQLVIQPSMSSTLTETASVSAIFPRKICCCLRNTTHLFLTVDQIKLKMAAIVRDLTVDKKMLSSERRKRQCANDARTSSKSLGHVGATVILLFFISIAALDFVPLRKDGYSLRRRIRRR